MYASQYCLSVITICCVQQEVRRNLRLSQLKVLLSYVDKDVRWVRIKHINFSTLLTHLLRICFDRDVGALHVV